MSGKTLSTSTLSLRFMQNAQRAKCMKEVELEKAEVRDDAKWEVGQEVREAWGLLSERDDLQTIIHEASYLPFIFSNSVDATAEPTLTSNLPKGRRKFSDLAEDEEKPNEEPEELMPEQKGNETSGRSRLHPHPIPIQSVSGKLIGGLDALQPPRAKTTKVSKSAREVIFDNSGVGTDIRTVSAKHEAEIAFLKPSGVDSPPESNKSKSKRSNVLDGARKKHKRIREGSEETDGGRKKSKKKQIT